MKQKETRIFSFTLLLILASSTIMAVLPLAFAQEIEYSKATHAYIGAIPNPVGINQETLLHLGIPDFLAYYYQSWEGLTVTVTDPQGNTQTLGPYRTDSTGGTGAVFIPTMVGTYKLQSHFPEQTFDWAGGIGARSPFTGVVHYKSSDSEILELIVTEEAQPYYPGHSLPKEYWTRPIDAQMREWSSVAGNFLSAVRYQAPLVSSPAPETGHILWTKPLEYGGLVGSDLGYHAFEEGDAYEGKFQNSVIINGVLYYNQYQPRGGSNVEQDVVAVDLRTGEEIWRRNWDNNRLAFGQIFYWDSFNMHGAFPYLWSTSGSTWNAYDVQTGRWVYSMENVPSGSNVYGPKGEIYRYTVNTQNGWMTLWNSSRTVQPMTSGTSNDGSWRPQGNVYDAREGIDWNVSIPTGLKGSVNAVFYEDRIIGTNARGEANIGLEIDPVEMWCISVKPGEEGTLMWQNSWQPPPGDFATGYSIPQGGQSSTEEGVFVLFAKEIKSFFGFDMDTGEQLWGPTESEHYMNMFSLRANVHFGKLFSTGYAGTTRAYDPNTGNVIWEYNAVDSNHEILWSNNWATIFSFFTPDEKIILFTMEHSPIDPKPRGGPLVCLDANTGTELWKLNIYGTRWGGPNLIGDGIIVAFNAYDNQLYAIGKGPSETSVTASPKVSSKGSSVLVEGNVIDISAGTQRSDLVARFPKGVPAVSDQSTSKWMEYVYMQHERPEDVTGVQVTLTAIDSNGNSINIGTTPTDSSGFYSHKWVPENEGKYVITASFTGSGSYWPSHDKTSIVVDPQHSPSTPIDYDGDQPTTPFITTEVAIIAAVAVAAVIGIAAYWFLKRK
ncbi:MAG: PQQ-binding-like beta-propeller repeat protein [Candidatus Bathyarchaeota archaeon]|nr:PQQ-binding-like beta-propeller repeat protein [Candidatus Bathyarchaeum tardum]WGM90477.1 MAG: PQQ-binding-like beta-propeller repeat protein [Candidatus Bathyarchaeum tardum]